MIEGYSSADGNKTYNEELSEKRANAVLEYLIKLGVPAERLDIL
jgi:OOP family OmpA-OmpF porin